MGRSMIDCDTQCDKAVFYMQKSGGYPLFVVTAITSLTNPLGILSRKPCAGKPI